MAPRKRAADAPRSSADIVEEIEAEGRRIDEIREHRRQLHEELREAYDRELAAAASPSTTVAVGG